MKNVAAIFSIFFCFTTFGCKRGENEVIVLPHNYTGYVLIIYNQKHGSPPKYDRGRRIYEIPASGILKTQFKENSGWTVLPEFYYENVSLETKVLFRIEHSRLQTDSVVASGGVSGSANKDFEGEEVVRFTQYYIGNAEQIDTAYAKIEKLDIASMAE